MLSLQIGDTIRRLCREKNITQERLADAAKTEEEIQKYLSDHWDAMKRGNPSETSAVSLPSGKEKTSVLSLLNIAE